MVRSAIATLRAGDDIWGRYRGWNDGLLLGILDLLDGVVLMGSSGRGPFPAHPEGLDEAGSNGGRGKDGMTTDAR